MSTSRNGAVPRRAGRLRFPADEPWLKSQSKERWMAVGGPPSVQCAVVFGLLPRSSAAFPPSPTPEPTVPGDGPGRRIKAESHLEPTQLLLLNADPSVVDLREQVLFRFGPRDASDHFFDVVATRRCGTRFAYTVKPEVRLRSGRFLPKMAGRDDAHHHARHGGGRCRLAPEHSGHRAQVLHPSRRARALGRRCEAAERASSQGADPPSGRRAEAARASGTVRAVTGREPNDAQLCSAKQIIQRKVEHDRLDRPIYDNLSGGYHFMTTEISDPMLACALPGGG